MYSPEIKPEKVRQLYQLKLRTGKKMTQMVDEAVGEYIARHRRLLLEGVPNEP